MPFFIQTADKVSAVFNFIQICNIILNILIYYIEVLLMINKRKESQNQMEVVMLEQLVPQDHLLRKIDKYIDFSFIRE